MDPQRLREALIAHFDQKITPQVAAAIFGWSTECADKAVDLGGIELMHHNGYVFHVERLADVLDELHPMHQAHYAETELHRAGLTMDPDYDGLLLDEQFGRLLQFTCRKDGELVGQVRMYVGRSRHTKTLMADEDTLYLKPEHRGGFTAVQFLRYVEAVLIHLGVREINANSKLVNKADVLMRRLGYQPVATQFTKIIPPEQTHVQE